MRPSGYGGRARALCVLDAGSKDQVDGYGYWVEDEDTGYLKVSFFGPFYGSYVIFELDRESYQYAFVSGPDTSYLWLLSRQPQVDEQLIQRFIEQSRTLGFDPDSLIFVDHSPRE